MKLSTAGNSSDKFLTTEQQRKEIIMDKKEKKEQTVETVVVAKGGPIVENCTKSGCKKNDGVNCTTCLSPAAKWRRGTCNFSPGASGDTSGYIAPKTKVRGGQQKQQKKTK